MFVHAGVYRPLHNTATKESRNLTAVQELSKFQNGRIKITYIACSLVLLGYVIELFNYWEETTGFRLVSHYGCILASLVSIFLLIDDAKNKFAFAFCLSTYAMDFNLLLNFTNIVPFAQAVGLSPNEFFLRSLFFVLSSVACVGFIADKKHVLIQSSFLLALILTERIYINDAFINQNFPLLFGLIIGIGTIIYYIGKNADQFIRGLYMANYQLERKEQEIRVQNGYLQNLTETVINLSKLSVKKGLLENMKEGDLEEVLRMIAFNTDSKRVKLWCLDEETDCFYSKLVYDKGHAVYEDYTLIPNEIVGLIRALKRQPFVQIDDVQNDQHYNLNQIEYFNKMNIRSVIFVPIKIASDMIGVISFEKLHVKKPWRVEHALILQAASDQIALLRMNAINGDLMHNVKRKNDEILDSIHYAKRLQNAILPPRKLVEKYFFNSFILYKPKDIVAGDFYWMEVIDNMVYFALADCTGHGVPGAIVSVICLNALNQSTKTHRLTDPAAILEKTKEIVIEQFEMSDVDIYDGMDISLCVYDLERKELTWAGANSPLLLYNSSKKTLTRFTPNKQPIGKFFQTEPFVQQRIPIEKGDTIYLYSDGYIDQFGGEKGKKMKYRKLEEFVSGFARKEMSAQHELFDQAFEKWKGTNEQIDDVCLIGVRFDELNSDLEETKQIDEVSNRQHSLNLASI